MKKFILGIAIVLFILFGIVVVTKDIVARAALIKGIKALTGLEVSVQKVSIGILKSYAGIFGLKVSNPPEFKELLLADVPEIYVEYDLPSLFKNKVHLKELRLNIKELHVAQENDGKLNVQRLAPLMPKPLGAKPPEITIDELTLIVGKVIYKNYSQGPGPKDLEYDLNIHETFRNVSDPSKLAGQVIVKILSRVGISDFLNVNLNAAKERFSGISQQGQALVAETAGKP